jgi:hypothetical protein
MSIFDYYRLTNKIRYFKFLSSAEFYMPIVTTAIYRGRKQTDKDWLADPIIDRVVKTSNLQK